MRYHFSTWQLLPYPIETVFSFFAEPANLPRLMPPWQAARIESTTLVEPPPPPRGYPYTNRPIAGSGSKVSLSLRAFPLSPLRLPWDAVIEDFRWLDGFCDLQQRGPFKYWRHCHSVRVEVSGTHLCDEVEYELPFGALGRLAHSIAVRKQIEATFRYRQRRALELLAQKS